MSLAPPHPGAILAEALDTLGRLPRAHVARMLGISRQQLYDILGGRAAISPTVAAKLGKLLGSGARIWLEMQAEFDAWEAEQTVDVSGIETLFWYRRAAPEPVAPGTLQS